MLRLLTIVLFSYAIAHNATAQVGIDEPRACSDMHAMKEQLLKKYDEEPVASGVLENGNLFVVFSRKDGSTFSVVMIVPTSKMACLVGSGNNWSTRVPGVSL